MARTRQDSRTSGRPYAAMARFGRALALAMLAATTAHAQQDNPVYVDDSPQARELLRQAKDQTRENAGEAVRLYQELLNDFTLRLVPASDVAGDLFTSARRRSMAMLQADQSLLDRYRLVQTPAAEQLLQDGKLLQVAMSYTLTEPGIEALLRLSQQELEAGRFRAALSWLKQALAHPDCVGRRAAHAHFMAATAWHDLADDSTSAAAFEFQRKALEDLGPDGAMFLAELDKVARADRPIQVTDVTMLDRAPEPVLNDVVPQTIWSVPLDESLLRRRLRAVQENDDQGDGPAGGRMRDPDLATAAVTVLGPLALINEGHTILALERLTGREVWAYQDLSRMSLTDPGNVLDALDMSVVAVDGDTLVTLTGHAQPNRRSDGGRVLCLNVSDGERRWSSPLTGIIDTAADESLFAHGAPVIMDGRVFVLARKVSTQLLTSAFVVALDANDGGVLWWRYLTSSGGLRIAPRPFDSIIARDGALYVSSSVGATARLDPVTGETIWLRRFNVPINQPLADQTRRPWEMIAPVITSRGLVTLQPDGRRVMLLDLETGDELANHSAGSTGDWNSPRYLLSDGDRVFSVGNDIRGFNVDNLEEPIWRIPAPMVQAAPNAPPPMETIDLRGRVQLAGDKLIAPTMQGLLVIDGVTGAIEQTLPIDASGNPMAYEAQLMVAGADRLDAYMSLRRAEEMLRRQIAQMPDSPDPALSLLQLGMRAGNIALALEAADKAMAATEMHADDPAFDERRFAGRAELFNLLLDLARTSRNLTPDQGESVFARMQAAAIGPEQHVKHLLAYGDWLAGASAGSGTGGAGSARALSRAVETWQAVLSDQRFATVWLNEEGIARSAWSRAADRIGRLIAKRGQSTYSPQSDFAALRLTKISAPNADGSSAGPEALLALAREFPFAPAAVEATLQAAAMQAQQDDVGAALASMLATYSAAPTKNAAMRIFGRYADMAGKAGRSQQAVEVLQAIRNIWGDINLELDQPPAASMRISEQLARLEGSQGPQSSKLSSLRASKPHLGLVPAQGVALGAPLIRLEGVGPENLQASKSASLQTVPTDRFLVRDGNTVRLITSADIKGKWSTVVEGSSPTALRLDDRMALLWFGADVENPRAVRLNADDGSIVWTSTKISDVLPIGPMNGDRLRISREQMPNGDSYDPAETLAMAYGEQLIVINRGGTMASLDLADGRSVKWSQHAGLQQVHMVALRQGRLVLAGMARDVAGETGVGNVGGAGGAGLVPQIVVFDAMTGRPAFGGDGVIRPPMQRGVRETSGSRGGGGAGVRWMTISPLGVLVYGTNDGLDAVDLSSGERRWSTAVAAAVDTQRGWDMGGSMTQRVVFEDQRSRLRTVRLADGVISDTFELPLRGEWDPMELRDVIVDGESVIANYRQRIVIFDAETGHLLGADAVADDRDFRWLLMLDDRLEAISGSSVQAGQGGGAGGGRIMRTQYQYTAFPLSRNGKVLGLPTRTEPLPERVQQVAAIDGWLLFSTLTDTLAVPMTEK